MPRWLVSAARQVSAFNEHIGRAAAWLAAAVVPVAVTVVLLRYGFSRGDVRLQEAYVWLHALSVMLGLAYTLRHDAHVRVDIFYARAGRRGRALIDCFGTVVLCLPLVATLLYVSWPYVASAWQQLESSREAGGLPGLFVLKSGLLVMFVLLGLEALAMSVRVLTQTPAADCQHTTHATPRRE